MPKNVIACHNVNILGNGDQPLLFAHGLACDQNVWNYITPAFLDEFKIILFDFIGSGNSDLTCYEGERYASLKGYAVDVLEICEELNLKDVTLVCHSVSSMIGLYAAILKPNLFSKLIMIGPSPCYINDHPYEGGFEKQDIDQLLTILKEDYTKWVELFAPMVIGESNNTQLITAVKEIFCKADPAITYEFAKVAFLSDSRNDLQNLTTNTLLMQLSEDLLAPQNVGEYLHKNISNSTLYNMNATGHFPHLSAPGETISFIKQYLSR